MADKLDSETALAKIKVLVGNYYETLGRGEYNDAYDVESGVLREVDDILYNVDIDVKKVVIEKLEFDKDGLFDKGKKRRFTGNAF